VKIQISKFTKINGGDGLQTVGVVYEGVENLAVSGWYYHANNQVDMVYMEGDYEGKYSAGAYNVGVQYALQDQDNSSAHANIYGVMAEITHEASGLSLMGAYNKVYSKGDVTADNYLGGGPFFTSDEHLTLAEAGVDGKAYLLGLTYAIETSALKGITVSVNRGYFKGVDAKAVQPGLIDP